MSHSSPIVLRHAVATIQHLSQTTSLANTNATKIIELEDELATSVRELLAGREELDIVTFTEDEVHALSAFVLRLHTLYGVRDMTTWMEEDDGGKVARLVDILGALTERGRLGYKEEEMVSLCGQFDSEAYSCGMADDERVVTTFGAVRCMESTIVAGGPTCCKRKGQRIRRAQNGARRTGRAAHRVCGWDAVEYGRGRKAQCESSPRRMYVVY
jgi:hypothetical protein